MIKFLYKNAQVKTCKENQTINFETIITSKKRLVTKYVFDKSKFENLIPIFNEDFISYEIVDELASENLITRCIYSEQLPTMIRFSIGNHEGDNFDGRELALIEVLYLDNSNLQTEEQMFHMCCDLKAVSGFISNKMHKTNHMFAGCSKLTQLDVSKWDMIDVTAMQYMFYDCYNLPLLDIYNWNTSNVFNMSYMFFNCFTLTALDMSNFDMSKVSYFNNVFDRSGTLSYLDLGNFNIEENVSEISNIFNNVTKLKTIVIDNDNPVIVNKIIANLNTKAETDQGILIANNIADISQLNVAEATSKFWNVYNNVALCYSHNTSTTTNPTYNEGFIYEKATFANSNNTTTVVITSEMLPKEASFMNKTGLRELLYINSKELETGYGMFYNCKNLNLVRMTDVEEVSTMEGMFNNCAAIKTFIGLNKWFTINSENFGSTFKTIDLLCMDNISNLIVNNAHSIGGIIGNNDIVEELDLNKWQTTYLRYCSGLLQSCTKLKKIDLSNIETKRLLDINGLIQSCSSLEEIDFSNWIIEPEQLINESQNLFDKAYKINKIKMHNSNSYFVNLIISRVLAKTDGTYGVINATVYDDVNNINIAEAEAKGWKVRVKQQDRLYRITSYRFDNTKASLFPKFNDGFEYSYKDCVYGKDTYRTIWAKTLPTYIKFGNADIPQSNADSLLSMSHCHFEEITDFSNMFKGCRNLFLCVVPAFATSKASTMASMFEDCISLKRMSSDEWDVSNVVDFSNMFKNCTSLKRVDLTTLPDYNTGLTYSLNIDNGKNPNVTGMFEGCSAIEKYGVQISAKDLNYLAANNGLVQRTIFDPIYPELSSDSTVEEVNQAEINKYNWYFEGYDYLDLFVMMGQSNMQGQSEIAKEFNVPDYQACTYLYNTDEIAEVKHPFGENIQTLGTYEELGYYQLEGAVGCETGEPWGSLSPHFAAACYEQTKVPMLMVQCARGATTMKDWLPGTTQQRFEIAVEKVKKSIEAVETRLGRPIRRRHLVWLQGESDGAGTAVGTKCATYKTRFMQFWPAIKEELALEKCLIIRVGKFREGYSYNCIPILEAQEQLANENEDILMITRITGYLEYPEQNPENPTLQHAFQGLQIISNHDHYTWEGYKLVGSTAGERVGIYMNTGVMPELEQEPYSDVNSTLN